VARRKTESNGEKEGGCWKEKGRPQTARGLVDQQRERNGGSPQVKNDPTKTRLARREGFPGGENYVSRNTTPKASSTKKGKGPVGKNALEIDESEGKDSKRRAPCCITEGGNGGSEKERLLPKGGKGEGLGREKLLR